MDLILRALKRSKLGAFLIVLQIALTVAVLANVIAVVTERYQHTQRHSGISEAQLVSIQSSHLNRELDVLSQLAAERAVLEKLPGLEAATVSNTMPLSQSGWSMGMRSGPEKDARQTSTALYFAEPHYLKTMGVRLLAGRYFDDLELQVLKEQPDLEKVIITESLAKEVFPEQTLEAIVGKRVSMRKEGGLLSEVVGVVSDISSPWTNWGPSHHATLIPAVASSYSWILRAKPGVEPKALGTQALAALSEQFRDSIYQENFRTMREMRSEAFRSDVSLMAILAGFALLMLAVTVLGMVGLASFWVTQRTRQIGVKRALGARMADIQRYFQSENLLLAMIGSSFGIGLAYGMNFLMSKYAGMDALPIWPVVIGVLVLIAAGQVAVARPARAASRIAPALATRTA
jgi:putative ABC transport system permease protein